MAINLVDKIIAQEQEKRGYNAMESVYLSNLLNERITLITANHVRLLESKLKALGVFFSVQEPENSGELVTIALKQPAELK